MQKGSGVGHAVLDEVEPQPDAASQVAVYWVSLPIAHLSSGATQGVFVSMVPRSLQSLPAMTTRRRAIRQLRLARRRHCPQC